MTAKTFTDTGPEGRRGGGLRTWAAPALIGGGQSPGAVVLAKTTIFFARLGARSAGRFHRRSPHPAPQQGAQTRAVAAAAGPASNLRWIRFGTAASWCAATRPPPRFTLQLKVIRVDHDTRYAVWLPESIATDRLCCRDGAAATIAVCCDG